MTGRRTMPESRIISRPSAAAPGDRGAEDRLARLLEEQAGRINTPGFIAGDPVQFPRRYSRLQDIETAGILCATIAWGRRASILASCRRMLDAMGDSPYRYVMEAGDVPAEGKAVHRTFSQSDLAFFLKGLGNIYRRYGSLEEVFAPRKGERGLWDGIGRFRNEMLSAVRGYPLARHISCPERNSACKRLHLFLRWMVRRDGIVDLGVWQGIRPSELSIPLDVHVGHISRRLGLLARRQNDRRAVEELDAVLRRYDPQDPVKYDFALFGLGESGFFAEKKNKAK